MSSLAVASAGALAAGVYKIAKDQKRLRTQEELVAEVREQMEAMGTIATLYVELYESSEERLVGGVILKMSAITALSTRTVSCITKRKTMIIPNSLEEIASYVEQDGKKVFVFSADWCGDCRYLKPFLPEIETEILNLPLS